MTSIRDLAERAWQGEADLREADHPLFPVAGGQAEEIADGVLYMKSLAGVTAIDSGDGLVMLDTGGMYDRDNVYDQVRSWRPAERLAAAVYSHHHVDHVFGTARFETEAAEQGWPAPVVYAHAGVPDHFRRYMRTRGWNTAINRRQFAIPGAEFEWPAEYRFPDVTYDRGLTFSRGGLTLDLHHGRGETDDATWTWVPELRLLHPGDLFIWAVPNAGNPQKVQRYLSDWAVALRQMTALEPEIMVCGHGLPIFGADRIATALSDTAALLESLEEQTLVLMNRGLTLDEVIHTVEVPADLADRPWLRPVYDHPQFLVRNVWRRYGGWWDGEPDNLLPAPRAAQARAWVGLAGGIEAVLAEARRLADAGDDRLACHLVEFAVLAEPDSRTAHDARSEIYGRRAAGYDSSMARNILNHAAEASRQGRRDLAGG